MKRVLLIGLIGLVALVACGGGGSFDASASDNPPFVEGAYSCLSNCSDDDCVYSSVIEIDQSDSTLIAYTYAGTLTGAIDDDGNFIVGDNNQECSGEVNGDSFTVVCESLDGSIACPKATFIAQ